MGAAGRAADPISEEGASILGDLAVRSLLDVVTESALRRPDHPAIVDRNGARKTSYRDLLRRVSHWAGRLAAEGVSAGTPVGLSADADLGTPLGFLAILAAGGIVVPFDTALPAARRAELAASIGCRLILSPDQPLPFSADIDPGEAKPPSIDHDPGRTAVIYHTSGSTGRPKPVAIAHSALSARLLSMAEWFGIDESEVVVAGSSASFDPFLQQLFFPLTAGGTMWMPERVSLLDPVRFWREASAIGVTHLNLVPSQMRPLLRDSAGGPMPPLRRVVLGGERMPVDLPGRIIETLGSCAVFNMYGPTEATVDATGGRVELPVVGDDIPIGRPLPGCRLRILDENLARVPAGEPGELFIGGAGLASGYVGMLEASAERFIPDPFGRPGELLFRTGDFVRLCADGQISFVGRGDDQVKIRGRRLELGEVEAAIESFPGVSAAAVKVWTDAPGGPALVAHVVGLDRSAEGDLRKYLSLRLVDAAIPARFVLTASLPMMPSGKVDKHALPDPEPLIAPAVARSQVDASALERQIADVWAGLLRCTDVDVNANLFEMGAHSLMVPAALEAIQGATGLRPEAVDLFRYPSVAALAKALSGHETAVQPKRGRPAAHGPIAIIGAAARIPGADGLDAIEALVFSGAVAVRRFDRETLVAKGAPAELIDHPDFVPVHGAIEGTDRFDPLPFGLSAGEAAEIDPQQRLLLELSSLALDDAACDVTEDGPVGVFVGSGFNSYLVDNLRGRLGFAGGFERYSVVVASGNDFAATRIAYKQGLTGPAMTVASACSTALSAVAAAVDSLRAGRCRVALAGAASLGMFSPFGHIASDGGIASPTGACRPFDAAADGLTAGAGAGLFVLKRLEDAEADGDRILGVILGLGITNDGGHKAAFAAPTVDGQAAAIAQALDDAGVGPAEIGFVEAHGTATAIGDVIEVAALNSVFTGLEPNSVILGSVKGAVGHLDAAAGVAGLSTALVAVRRGEIPPTVGFAAANPRIAFADGPFRVSGSVEPWPGPAGRRRLAGVSAFGMGGTNVHLILAAPDDELPVASDGEPALMTVSAATTSAADVLAGQVTTTAQFALADIAAALARRRQLPHRRMVVARDGAELARSAWIGDEARGGTPMVALSYPGQGAQRPGMARALYAAFPVYRAVVDAAHDILAGSGAADLRRHLLAASDDQAAAEALTHTELTQPALFIVGCATTALLRSFGVRPGALIGHSVGEYVAAHVAGVVGFEDALRLVVARGRLMASAAPGAMLALSLSEQEAAPMIARAGADLAAINGPRQCVAAGTDAVIAGLEQEAERLGRPARRLAVSHAFHSALMEPILEEFGREVAKVTLHPSLLPVVSNVTGAVLTADQACDPGYWVRHLRHTVRLVDGLKALKGLSGKTVLVEAGPGNTLTRSARACGFGEAAAIATDPDPAGDGHVAILQALGRLWTQGVDIDRRAAAGHSIRRTAAPAYPFERVHLWISPDGQDDGVAPNGPRSSVIAIAEGGSVLDDVLAEWRDVLGATGVGPDDDFFELGGDSLLAVRLVARLRRRLGQEIAIADLFAARTPAGLMRSLHPKTNPSGGSATDREEGWL
ncbi:MAG: non ribosomal peptide synthetase [Proteobacteria bacterium]|nr:non ribosomal peptide synthetase [Pseudomonadota bacterium]